MTDLGTIDEQATPEYSATLSDEATDLPITRTQIQTMTLTLYTVSSRAIVNSRDAQDVLGGDKSGTNDCTFDATSGLFTWKLQVADTAITSTNAQRRERRRAVFVFTWLRDGETKRATHAIEFTVVNEPKVS